MTKIPKIKAPDLAATFGVTLTRARLVLESPGAKALLKVNPETSIEDFARFFPSEIRDLEKLGVISFFSGCGGLDLGFKNAGYQLLYANDFFGSATLTYSENIGPQDPRSIYDVETLEVPSGDVLLAGFPCQPFSNAGSRQGTSDPRGTLFWETLRFVDKHKPKILVFENVRGLLSMVNPDGKKLIDAIENEIRVRGYRVTHKLLNTADFGVPQNRHRVLVVGLREDVSNKVFDFQSIQMEKGSDIQNVLKSIPKKAPNQVHWQLSPQAIKLLEHIPEGGSWKNVPDEFLPERLRRIRSDMVRYHSPNFFRRFARNEIMGTVTAAATPENSGIIHSFENRRFTVREVAAFQTFPMDFKFEGTSVSAMYKQIGNAVPVEFARRLALALKQAIS